MIVAEERKEARDAIRDAHNLAMSKSLIEQWMPELAHLFPISKSNLHRPLPQKRKEFFCKLQTRARGPSRGIRGEVANPNGLFTPCLANSRIQFEGYGKTRAQGR